MIETAYDVIIAGGGMIGASAAWWLTHLDPKLRVAVIERDPSYETASTSHTNSCIRQQFSNSLNIQISQFGAEFIKTFKRLMGADDAPDIPLQSYGYMYLADDPAFAASLAEAQKLQAQMGAGTRHMSRDEIAAAYPFYNLDDIIAANHNLKDEGYFDGGTIFDWLRKMAKRNGVAFIHGEIIAINTRQGRVTGVSLADGSTAACGHFVNATGPRGARTARMAGLDIPVVPRKRYTYIFDAAQPLDRDLPLTIDPSGVHMRTDGRYYLAGCPPDIDPDVEPDDFGFDHSLWESKVWPAIATRIPQFEAIKVINEWVGHYAYNTLDQNAIIGPSPSLPNFIFVNGFSGHGLQQSPAMGRGVAELIVHGGYRSIDLGPLGVERTLTGEKFMEKAVI